MVNFFEQNSRDDTYRLKYLSLKFYQKALYLKYNSSKLFPSEEAESITFLSFMFKLTCSICLIF